MVNRRLSASVLAVALLLVTQVAWAQTEITSTAQLKQAFATGGTYTVAAGNYWLDENVVVENNLTLVGEGAEATVVLITVGRTAITHRAGVLVLQDMTLGYTANTPGDILATFGGTAELAGLVLSGARGGNDSSGAKSYGWGSAIVAWDGAEVYLTNSTIKLSGLSAIEMYGLAQLHMVDSAITNNNVGLYAEEQTYIVVTDSLFEGNTFGAYQNRGQAEAHFTGNHFLANGVANEATGHEYDGVYVGEVSTTTFTNNHFENNPRFALSAWGNAVIETTNNLFTGNGGEYDSLDTYASAVLLEEFSRMTMRGDRFINNPGGALELGDDSQATLTAVHMEGNGSWAFIYTEDNTVLQLVDSSFDAHAGSIFVSGTGQFLFTNSHATGSLDDAIILAGALEAWIEDSVVQGSSGIGVAVYDAVKAYISNSEFSANRSGVVLYQESLAIAENNRFSDNERTGIAAFDGSTLEARNNSFSANGFNGVLVDDQAHAVVERNQFSGNPRAGISFAGQSKGSVAANTISGSGAGLALAGGAQVDLFEDNVFEGNQDDVVEGL